MRKELTARTRVVPLACVVPPDEYLSAGRGNRLPRWGVVAAATVVAIAGCSGGDAPSSPQAAAQAWADAGLHHDRKAQQALTCAAGSEQQGLNDIVTVAITSWKAGPARQNSPTSWGVPMQAVDVGGGTQATLTFRIVREHDKYLVC